MGYVDVEHISGVVEVERPNSGHQLSSFRQRSHVVGEWQILTFDGSYGFSSRFVVCREKVEL